MLAAFGNHGYGPLIVFGDGSGQFRLAVGLEPNLFTYPKVGRNQLPVTRCAVLAAFLRREFLDFSQIALHFTPAVP